VIGALCSVVSGCDGCDDGGGTTPPGGHDMAVPIDMTAPPPDGSVRLVSYSEFSAHYADALCKRYLACGLIDQASMDRCLERNTRKIGWDVDTEILKGRVEINEARCIDAVNSSRCDRADSVSVDVACATGFYIPHLAINDVCLGGVECINGYCAHEGSDAGVSFQPSGCPGVCTAFKATGAPCVSEIECGVDSICDVPPNGSPGDPTVCIKLLTPGQDCDPAGATLLNCDQRNSYCPYFGTDHKCVSSTTHAENEACDINQNYGAVPACADGFYCKLAADGLSATCTKEIADGTNECQVGEIANPSCAAGKMCMNMTDPSSATGTCQLLGRATEPCVAYGPSFGTCQLGYYCEAAAVGQIGACKPLIADGQPCGSNFQCASAHPNRDTTCVVANADAGTQTTCQPSKGFGDSCNPGFEDSVCFPSDSTGSAYCAPANNGGGVCQPRCF